LINLIILDVIGILELTNPAKTNAKRYPKRVTKQKEKPTWLKWSNTTVKRFKL